MTGPTAPDLDNLETVLLNLEGGVDCLNDIIDDIPADSREHSRLAWLLRILRRDMGDLIAWHQDAFEADKATGPVAVT